MIFKATQKLSPQSPSSGHDTFYSKGMGRGLIRVVTADQYLNLASKGAFYPNEIIFVRGTFSTKVDAPMVSGLFIENQVDLGTHIEEDMIKRNAPFATLANFEAILHEIESKNLRDTPVEVQLDSDGIKIRKISQIEMDASRPPPSFIDPVVSPKKQIYFNTSQEFSNDSKIEMYGQKFFNLNDARSLGQKKLAFPLSTGFSFGHYFEFLRGSRGTNGESLASLRRKLIRQSRVANLEECSRLHLNFQEEVMHASLDEHFLDELIKTWVKNYGTTYSKFKLRTSTQNEDQIAAGLYKSVTVTGVPGTTEFRTSLETGVKEMYASLDSPRAYFTRNWFHLNEQNQAMAFFTHPFYGNSRYGGTASFTTDGYVDTYEVNVFKGDQTGTNPDAGDFVRRYKVLDINDELKLMNENTGRIKSIDKSDLSPLTMAELYSILFGPGFTLNQMVKKADLSLGPSPNGKRFSTEWLLLPADQKPDLMTLQFKVSEIRKIERPVETDSEVVPDIQPAVIHYPKSATRLELESRFDQMPDKNVTGLYLYVPGNVMGLKSATTGTSFFWVEYKKERFIVMVGNTIHSIAFAPLTALLKKGDSEGKILLGLNVRISETEVNDGGQIEIEEVKFMHETAFDPHAVSAADIIQLLNEIFPPDDQAVFSSNAILEFDGSSNQIGGALSTFLKTSSSRKFSSKTLFPERF